MKFTEKIKKSAVVLVTDDDLKMENKFKMESHRFNVGNSYEFWLQWFPNGNSTDTIGHVSVFLRVSGPAIANFTITLGGTDVKKNSIQTFEKNEAWGYEKFATHQKIRDSFKYDIVCIICDVEFSIEVFPTHFSHNIFESCEDLSTDCELVVENKSVKVHKHFLALISPTLFANFAHDTIEAKTGKVVITDFDFNTVKVCIDYLYGRDLVQNSVESVVIMLRFFDKYNIKSKNLERIPYNNITTDNFSCIVNYAFDCCKTDLLDVCADFFSHNMRMLRLDGNFEFLDNSAIVIIMKKAFNLTSFIDVIRFACEYTNVAVISLFESNLSITLENFCEVASYAWGCNRTDVQKKCAEFFKENNNFHEIIFTDEFIALSAKLPLILQFAKNQG